MSLLSCIHTLTVPTSKYPLIFITRIVSLHLVTTLKSKKEKFPLQLLCDVLSIFYQIQFPFNTTYTPTWHS